MDATTLLSGDQVSELGLEDWRPILDALQARFATRDFSTGLELVNRIGEVAEELGHHPDLDLRYTHLNVRLTSHDVGGKTERDVGLARRISAIAAGMDVRAAPMAVSRLELALDTWDVAEIMPFWAAVLGLRRRPGTEDELYDAEGDLPSLWFQETDRHEEPRQRFHLDITVPPQQAAHRIKAALGAGGVLVSDAQAPRFTVLADAQGNKACVCTHVGRSH